MGNKLSGKLGIEVFGVCEMYGKIKIDQEEVILLCDEGNG